MAKKVNQILAEALAKASKAAFDNILHTKELSRTERKLLIEQGYLKPIIKPWYLLDADLAAKNAGESALWYQSIWSFISIYLKARLGDDFWLSPEASLDLLTDNPVLSKQIIVYTNNSSSSVAKLPNNMEILIVKTKAPKPELVTFNGLPVYSLEAAVAAMTPAAYRQSQESAEIALHSVEVGQLALVLTERGNQAAAERVLGGLEAMGLKTKMRQLKAQLSLGGFMALKSQNPFSAPVRVPRFEKGLAPTAVRIRTLWQLLQPQVEEIALNQAVAKPFRSDSLDKLLHDIDDTYVQDAYHSLSIEGFQVTPELIERVSGGDWSPEVNARDKERENALAARGYYNAFQEVKAAIVEAYEEPDLNLKDAFDVWVGTWYAALFSPFVAAGIHPPTAFVGYRNRPVYIRGSRHVPPQFEQLADCMETLRDLLAAEQNPIVRAVLGHYFVGFIHPFIDGNGRTARFLMNYLLVTGGLPWTVVDSKKRSLYLESMELVTTERDIRPFTRFLVECMRITTETD